MKNHVRMLSMLLAIFMIAGLLTGCGNSASSTTASSAASEEVPASSVVAPLTAAVDDTDMESALDEDSEIEDSAPTVEAEEEATASDLEIVRKYTTAEALPLVDEEVTLTAWDYVVPPVMEVIHDYGTDGTVYAELQNRTGVHLDFTTANLLTATNDMALMVAAGDLPDIIFDFGMFYNGNLDDLIDGDIIVNFAAYEDVMPNYFDILNNNPSIARDVYTEAGNVPKAENIQSTLIPSSGPVIRQDWLDADGLEIPITVDELHETLLTFKAENDCAHPFWIAANGNSTLNSAFGITYNGDSNSAGGWIYQDDTIQFCLPMDGFRDYVQLMADWYAEGLISPDFVSQTMNNTATDDEIVGNACGYYTTSVNGMNNLSGYEPDAVVTPLRAVVLNEGDLNGFDDAGTSRISKGGASVFASGTDVELACRIIDYLYSEDGIILCNYGVEGETFEYDENGDPQLTELVTNHPEYDFTLALIKFTSATPASICINERNYLGYTDAQVAALDLWLRNTTSTQAPGALWTVEAQEEYNSIASDLGSYSTTNVLQFITGEKPMIEWDSFIEAVTGSFDIERMTELYQEAINTYLGV